MIKLIVMVIKSSNKTHYKQINIINYCSSFLSVVDVVSHMYPIFCRVKKNYNF